MKVFMMALCMIYGFLFTAPSKEKSPTQKANATYNQGLKLLKKLEFAKAESKFKSALKQKKDFPEAYNNLAYTQRKQGKLDAALENYNQAISLDSELKEAYMYRGVLFIQRQETEKAQQDFEKLKVLDKTLADELNWVISNGKEKEPEQFFGVSSKK